MYKKYGLLVIVLLSAVLSVGCGRGQTREEKIRNVFKPTRVTAKKEKVKRLLTGILTKIPSLQECAEEAEGYPEKGLEVLLEALEVLLEALKESAAVNPEQVAASLDKFLKKSNNCRPSTDPVLRAIQSKIDGVIIGGRFSKEEFRKVVSGAVGKNSPPDVSKEIESSILEFVEMLVRNIKEQDLCKMLLELKGLDLGEVMELYDASCELLSEILEGLRGAGV